MGNVLSGIIDSLAIGASLGDLRNGISSMRCNGGLFNKTTMKGYRYSNTVNNYNGGEVGSYGYSTLSGKDIFATDDTYAYENGNLVASYTVSDNIGDGYITYFGDNSGLSFKTTDDFIEFERLIRVNQIQKSNNFLSEDKYTSHKDKFSPSNKLKGGDVAIGNLVSINGDNSQKVVYKEIIKEYEDNTNLSEKITANNPNDFWGYSSTSSYKGVTSADEYYSNIISGNFAIIKDANRPKNPRKLDDFILFSKNDKKTWHYLLSGKNFEGYREFYAVETEFGEQINLSEGDNRLRIEDLTPNGIYAKYDIERQKALIKVIYTKDKPYGIDKDVNKTEKYSVGDKPFEKSSNVVNSTDSFFSHNPLTHNTLYRYYQEHDSEGETEGKINTEADTVVLGEAETITGTNTSNIVNSTNALFKKNKIGSLINRFHTLASAKDNSDLISAYDNKFGLSRGRNLLTKDAYKNGNSEKETGYGNPYCRVWTAHHQYSRLKDRIRPFIDENGNFMSVSGFDKKLGGLRPNNEYLKNYSTLNDNGFVKISSSYDKNGNVDDKKKYMFSIENLAWKDIINIADLSEEQKGPNNGRIMWFPPYNLRFQENINAQWEPHSFIGRGEEVYTYKNTNRSGTLDFTLLVDHPSIINKRIGRGELTDEDQKESIEQEILRFFAGCDTLTDEMSDDEIIYDDLDEKAEVEKIEPRPTYDTINMAYVMFFPNNLSCTDYKNNIESIINEIKIYEHQLGEEYEGEDVRYKGQILGVDNYVNSTSEQLLNTVKVKEDEIAEKVKKELFGNENLDKLTLLSFDELIDIESNFSGDKIYGYNINEYEIDTIEARGFASSHGKENFNRELIKNRRETIIKILTNSLKSVNVTDKIKSITDDLDGSYGSVITVQGTDINTLESKIARAACIIVRIKLKDDVKPQNEGDEDGVTLVTTGNDALNNNETDYNVLRENITTAKRILKEDAYVYDNEYLYFKNIAEKGGTDNLVLRNIVDKVRYFDPAFHSITPEGFNARLTFLQQCVRQGPTIAVSGGQVNSGSNNYLKYAGNLAFGRAPYCILRIGDFFHTKIKIDSITITYDNNGVQWDLNPEGVGVQPMFANVSMSFTFLGGQDISGPIERLQNAVTSNYYANTSVYSRHADTDRTYYDVATNLNMVLRNQNNNEN